MIKLHGATLLERSLDALVDAGITRIVLVVGYRSEGVRQLIGNSYSDIPVTYIDNPDYDTTNNVYSLYLARHAFQADDTLLLESDLVYDPKILHDLLADPAPNVAVVDRLRSWMDGTVVTIAADNTIHEFIPKKNIDQALYGRYFKTVNIYKFSKEYIRGSYVPFLEAYVQSVGSNEYYEQVLGVIASLEREHLAAMPLQGDKWYEIDDLQDYQIAQTLFAPLVGQYSSYLNWHGGYWRFPELRDFCYLVNPYFPPTALIDEMRRSFESLIRGYPSSATAQSQLAAQMFSVETSSIMVGNGAAELIHAIGQELKATRIAVSVPTFEEYLKRFPDAEIIEYSSRGSDFQPDLRQLKAVAAESDALVLVNPDNPSGQCLSTSDLQELVIHMEQEGKHLVLDESFVDFADPKHCHSILRQDVLGQYPHLIIVKSISKSYGVPGCRLGVIATADTELLTRVGAHLPVWNINSFGEYFLQIIGKYHSNYEIACQQLRDERSRFFGLLSAVPNCYVIPSQANFFLCQLGGSIVTKDLASRLLKEHAILIKDCSGKAGLGGRQFFRVAVRDAVDNDYLVTSLRLVISDLGIDNASRTQR